MEKWGELHVDDAGDLPGEDDGSRLSKYMPRKTCLCRFQGLTVFQKELNETLEKSAWLNWDCVL